ncbi:uncharacterized protein K452DRAFT_316448 [Aplosporella prunicola CBS 121167]|uniref:Hpc2-related domain-containing protein n=1 Tax=Aplosporella prunicola CBS 121167 TaxID=1176127 RepID=A0A6A6BM19_9PEZI|nr:uncharacterized protein K452DRAFT_316448 [Aplosporella prunicola CBS 121167]KAF2144453.1 hypothetical protein K452DRAFT_316448 [Aplosporella prunicola CBS 121167]
MSVSPASARPLYALPSHRPLLPFSNSLYPLPRLLLHQSCARRLFFHHQSPEAALSWLCCSSCRHPRAPACLPSPARCLSLRSLREVRDLYTSLIYLVVACRALSSMNAAGASSSSPELSTPPGSPDLADSATSAANGSHHASTINVLGGALPNNVAPTSAKYNTAASPPTTTTNTSTTTTTTGTKRPRKKKEPAPPATGEEKPKPTRRPRQPKDPNAPPTQRGKKRKTAAATAAAAAAETSAPAAVEEKPVPQPQQSQQLQQQHAASSRQPKITDLVGSVPAQPAPEQPIPNPSLSQVAAATPGPSTPRPASSGQLYDPIRSSTVPVTQHQHATAVPPVSPSSRVINRASASPSINSLIDPPSVPSQPHLSQQARFQAPLSVTSAPASPAPLQASQNPFGPPTQSVHVPQASPVQTSPVEVALEVQKPTPPKKTDTASTASSTSVITPPAPAQKPEKKKEAPAPMPTGSGLLSGMPFAGAMMNTKPETEGTNIWLTFPLKGQTNVTINFAREVEKKYGFAAMHPRIAAAKERRRQMAAATAALEKGSGAASADDMSVDLSEPESNVEMGGMDEELTQSGTVRKRKKKVEDYDKDDDFIDDTELAWEQSALMAKDGFFVYSGPLVTEGEKPAVERADGTVRRGRGRGRGGTSRGEASGRGNRGGGGGGGRARGGNTVRKPRVTKADRAMMEQEKLEREKMAQTLAAKPMTPYQGVAS